MEERSSGACEALSETSYSMYIHTSEYTKSLEKDRHTHTHVCMFVCNYVRAFSFKVIPLRMLQSLKMTIDRLRQQQQLQQHTHIHNYTDISNIKIQLERREIIKCCRNIRA